MTVIDEVYIERSRQINVEGFTAEHDDEHTGGALASAALCYIYDSTYFCDFSILLLAMGEGVVEAIYAASQSY